MYHPDECRRKAVHMIAARRMRMRMDVLGRAMRVPMDMPPLVP